eukprot:260583_1
MKSLITIITFALFTTTNSRCRACTGQPNQCTEDMGDYCEAFGTGGLGCEIVNCGEVSRTPDGEREICTDPCGCSQCQTASDCKAVRCAQCIEANCSPVWVDPLQGYIPCKCKYPIGECCKRCWTYGHWATNANDVCP